MKFFSHKDRTKHKWSESGWEVRIFESRYMPPNFILEKAGAGIVSLLNEGRGATVTVLDHKLYIYPGSGKNVKGTIVEKYTVPKQDEEINDAQYFSERLRTAIIKMEN